MGEDELHEQYLVDALKGKCKSFKLEQGEIVEYQINFYQWKANKGMRERLHESVRRALNKGNKDDSNSI